MEKALNKSSYESYHADEQIREVENYLNNRPRKCLIFLTPIKIFSSATALNYRIPPLIIT
jgi:IS30 family transposase